MVLRREGVLVVNPRSLGGSAERSVFRRRRSSVWV